MPEPEGLADPKPWTLADSQAPRMPSSGCSATAVVAALLLSMSAQPFQVMVPEQLPFANDSRPFRTDGEANPLLVNPPVNPAGQPAGKDPQQQGSSAGSSPFPSYDSVGAH